MVIDKIQEQEPLLLVIADSPADKKDLSRLVTAPSIQDLWVDKKGHIHQVVTISGLITLLKALIDEIHQLCSKVNDQEKMHLLVDKAEFLLNYCLEFVVDGQDIATLEVLKGKLAAIEQKLGSELEPLLNEKKVEISMLEKELKATQYFGELLKTVKAGAERFSHLTPVEQFLLIPPGAVEVDIAMIERFAQGADGLEHAARHLCVQQSKDKEAAFQASYTLFYNNVQPLVEAANEFKVIPVFLEQNPEALLQILANANDDLFALEVAQQLRKIEGGDEAIFSFLDSEIRKLSNPETQEKQLKRLLKWEKVLPDPRIQAAIADLEQLAVLSELPAPCEKILWPRGGIKALFYSYFNQFMGNGSALISLLERVQKYPDIFDDLCTRLFSADCEMASQVVVHLTNVLPSVLKAYAETNNAQMGPLVNRMMAGMSKADVKAVVDQEIARLSGDSEALKTLSFLQMGIAEDFERLGELSPSITEAFRTKATALKVENSEELFKKKLEEILATENGAENISSLIKELEKKNAKNFLLLLKNELKMEGESKSLPPFEMEMVKVLNKRLLDLELSNLLSKY